MSAPIQYLSVKSDAKGGYRMDDNKQKGKNSQNSQNSQDTNKKSDRTEFADEINVESKNKNNK